MADVERELAGLNERLERIEAQLQFLFGRLGISTRDAPAAKASPAVMDRLGRGDRKGALRAFMEETGAGLKDAKTVIESLQRGGGG